MVSDSSRIGPRNKMRNRLVAVATVAAMVTAGFALSSRSADEPTFGRVPEGVLTPERDLAVDPIREGEIPDYIIAWDGNNAAGYVKAADLFGVDGDGAGADGPLPVVNRNLELVGHMTSSGFVGLDQDRPRIQVSTTVVEG